mgnify:CR=1 FL=1
MTRVNNYLHRDRVLFATKIREAVAGHARSEDEAAEEMQAIARFLEDGTPASALGMLLPEGEDTGDSD